MRDLDDTDRKILQALRANARESIKGIAAQTGLARSTVRYRLQKLEDDGIITGYHVTLRHAPEKVLGAFLFVRLKKTPAHDLIARIAGFPEVKRCYSLAGDPDLIVEVEADNAERLNALRDAIATDPISEEVRTSLILNRDFEG